MRLLESADDHPLVDANSQQRHGQLVDALVIQSRLRSRLGALLPLRDVRRLLRMIIRLRM
jgi:hypothetical protein